jgi:hypothetical protein
MTKKWTTVLSEWESGNYPKMPADIKKPFLWRTSVLSRDADLPYKEEFTEDKRLLSHTRQDLRTFKEHFTKKENQGERNAVAFPNLSGDTILVVPVPRSGKQFTNFFYFMKNASKVQQSELWKVVAREARKMLKKNENVWISSHGLGIDYLHIRVCSHPKYYEKSKLQKLPKKK